MMQAGFGGTWFRSWFRSVCDSLSRMREVRAHGSWTGPWSNSHSEIWWSYISRIYILIYRDFWTNLYTQMFIENVPKITSVLRQILFSVRIECFKSHLGQFSRPSRERRWGVFVSGQTFVTCDPFFANESLQHSPPPSGLLLLVFTVSHFKINWTISLGKQSKATTNQTFNKFCVLPSIVH